MSLVTSYLKDEQVCLSVLVLLFLGSCLSEEPPSPEPSEPVAQSQPVPESQQETQAPELPPYKVLDTVNLITGGRYGDVLVETYSRETPKEERESVLRSIAAKENFHQAALYCSEEAYQANNSASFLRGHPNALETCFLGGLKDGVFTAGEELFP